VKPHFVSLGDVDKYWQSHMSLNEVVISLGEMVQYKRYHAEWTPPYPLDREVAKWVLEYAEPKGILNKNKPIDERLLVQP
jgi:hypothetical protein